ncbi:MAG: CRISPR-associated endonuclease Cas2 [Acholeplasmatales bacterium]|jgi:CRISPR-associated protein Cas2|nr:CRISPR-associated endonuclease Cas2 [Acholeplasmataceae bacterium]MCK9233793.1 CRISPR-associated endonuclease Cas2 [Acholeplasmataceae bacterium]MCK9289715.1 CRISPR-associated endonuclease Cas2 [Acholeplasmataceae bacterium]MCK9428046.1 CRISPR-associated endonuclease Cas2 [Acholeplasmataceae bacterium]MDY0115888.1 CRISPR-associated endonuclease Cas2 [Acholeplasmatales bacterium]
MRLIVLFDLPVQTKKQLRIYTRFRKFLISKGYLMLQYSVYAKILNNRDSAVKHMDIIKKNCPIEGHIRLLLLTEKQYARMEIVIGGKSRTENIITIDPFVYL